MNDERKRLRELYNNLKADNYDLPEYGTFERDMADDNLMRQLYDNIKADNYDVPDYETFRGDMGYGSYQQPAEQPQGLPVNPATFAPVAPAAPSSGAAAVRAPFANEEEMKKYEAGRAANSTTQNVAQSAQPIAEEQQQAQPLGPEKFQRQMEMRQGVNQMQQDFTSRIQALRQPFQKQEDALAPARQERLQKERAKVVEEDLQRAMLPVTQSNAAVRDAWVKAAFKTDQERKLGRFIGNEAARLKYHDIDRMSDDAWNSIDESTKQRAIRNVAQVLREGYGMPYDEARANAEKIVRSESDKMMYEEAVKSSAPKNFLDYLTRKINDNAFGSIMEGWARSKAGTTGDMLAREAAEQQYHKENWLGGIAGDVLALTVAPEMLATGGLAGGAVKGATKVGAKILSKKGGEAAMRKALETLAGKIAQGGVSSGVNLGAFNAIGEASTQYKHGGVVNEDGTIGDYNPNAIGKSAGKGVLTGLAIGPTGQLIGNVGTKMVNRTASTAGKAAIRGAQGLSSIIAEGTIFVMPEMLKGELTFDDWLSSIELMAGFKLQGGIKSAPERIKELAGRRGNNRQGFETRLRTMLDRNPNLALTKDEEAELKRGGYEDLAELVKDYKNTSESQRKAIETKQPIFLEPNAEGEIPYNRFIDLVGDKNISEAARAKMYYYVTGNGLPQSTMIGSNFIEHKDNNGNVTGYEVQSFGKDNGVITSRTFKSRKEAEQELERINRQAELNGVAMGEQAYDADGDRQRLWDACEILANNKGVSHSSVINMMEQVMRDPSKASEMQLKWAGEVQQLMERLPREEYQSSLAERKAIAKEYMVDINDVLSKEPSRRTAAEQEALVEYTKRLFADAMRDNSYNGKQIEGSHKRGYDADEQQRSDIAIEVADGKEGAEEAWDGVVQRINDDADMMAAEQREESRRRQFRGEGENKGALRPVTITTKNGEQREVYLTQGELALTESGLVDLEKTKELNNVGTLTAYDPVEGKEVSFAPSDIVEVGQITTAEQQEQNIETNKQAYIQQQQDAATGRFNPQPGQQIEVPDMGTATVLATDGETVTLQMPDGTQQSMAIADIQQIADGVAMEDYRQRHPEEEQPTEPATEAKGAPETFSDGMMLTVKGENGDEQQMEVIGRASYSAQPGSAGYREDPNGGYVALFVPGEEQPRYMLESKLREQTVDYREQEAEQPAAEVEQPTEDAAEQSTAGGAVPAGESAETAAAPAVAPEVEIYNNVKGEYPEAYRDKVENTVKIKAKRVADTKTALDKATAALTATEYGSKEEATAKQKRDKAQQAYDAAVADSEMWNAVKSLKDQELLAEREAKDAVEREERERRRAETEAARKREQEAYEAEMARRKAEQEEKDRKAEAALENMAKMRDEAAAVGADFPIEDDADAMEVMNDLAPHTLEEVAAWLLSDTKGKMKIDPEEMRRHTGYSSTDMNKFPFIFKKGGVSPEKFGEHIEQIARENGVSFDEADTNAGFNALLNVLGEVGGLSDLKNYIKDARRVQAERLHSQNVARAAAVQTEDDWIAQHGGMSREEYASYINWMEDAVEQGKTEITDEEFNQIFNTYDTRTATTDEESQRGGAAESGTDGAETRQAATAADDTRRGGEDAGGEGAAEVTARTEDADTPLKSLAEVKKFMETIGYKGSLSRVLTDDNGRKFVKYYASGNITPNIYLGETTPFDIWQQFNLYGNNMGVDIPADIKAELDRINEDARGASEALWAEDREQVKDLLTEAGIPFYDVIDSERGSRIIFTDRKNDNGNYVDYMDVADVDQAREDIAFVREKAERVNKQAAYQTEAEKAVTDIAEQLDNGRTAKNDELIQRIADMEAEAEERLEDGTLSDDERARVQAQYDAASKWMDDNVRSQKGMPAAPTAEQKTLTKGLVGWLNGIGIKTHAAVRKGQEVLNKYRELVRSLRAYHGSGADFEQFESSHIGEGMGVQRHGHGFYVTTHQGAAKGYAKDVAQSHDGTPIVYEVEIPEDNGKNYIDWTATIPKSERKKIAEAVRAIPEERLTRERHGNNWLPGGFGQLADMIERNAWGGMDIYDRLYDAIGSTKLTSDLLSGLGYKGVRVHEWSMPKGEYTYVIFNDNDLKITDKIRFQRAADGEYEPKPVFYSNAMNAVEGIKQEKATAEQWLAMLQKNGGLKAGEDKWIGLSDWLNDHKGKSLTKQEVMDYIRENQIEAEEVEYSDAKMPGNFASNLRNELNEKADEICGDVTDEYADKIAKAEDFSDELDDIEDEMIQEARHRLDDEFGVPTEHYISIQFENDRNRLVYTPTRSDRDFSNNFAQQVWNQRNGNEGRPINETRLQYTTDFLDNKREIALTIPTIEPWNESDEVHFGDAGEGRAVAWVRFGDTTDKDGKKVLVIDEIQSKRHQEGREKGYRKESTSELIKKQGELERRRIDMVREFQKTHPDDVNNEAWDAFVNSKEYKDILKEESETEDKIRASYNLIPDAPFDKNWHEVAFKRMLRYAAENGYDKVAWTTGEQQADRYNIGTVAQRLVINETKDGYQIVAQTNDGTFLHQWDGVSKEKLPDYVGKEIARKVESGENLYTKNGRSAHIFTGEELRIGGEGMKGFYDQILPRFADKYGKKWNVKTTDINLPNIGDNGLTMHSVDVTPEMKASVLEGQPMFFKDKDGEVIGYTVNGEIYIDPRYAKPETPVHEYAHLIVHAIRANNPQVWERWKQLAHGEQDVIDFVKEKYPEYSENEDDFWEEVIANYTGREGGKRLEDEMRKQMRETPDIVEKARIATIFHKLRDLLKRFWDMTKDIFSGSTKGIDNFQSMDDVVDLTLAALANKFDPRAAQKAESGERRMINPRSLVPQVRGGWNERKIKDYLKNYSTPSGIHTAARAITEFDNVEELKDHMFYHGTVYGGEHLKPSITMSERDAERYGGGGYGERYWGISLTKSKRIASHFSGASSYVKIYPIILLKGAKVIERPDFEDAADVNDHIVELWNDGVDAVWIGEGKQGKGEQELLVLNPRAVVNIGTQDFYKVYQLGTQDNPLRIADDETISKMYDTAKEFVSAMESKPMKPIKPMKPSFYHWDGNTLGDKKTDEEYAADMEKYEADMEKYEAEMEEYNNSEALREYQENERKAREDIRYQKGKRREKTEAEKEVEKITEQENGVLYHKAMEMQADYIAKTGRMPLEMGVFTDKHYVIVNNTSQGNISAVRAFDIEKQPKEIENEIVSLYRRNSDEGYSDVDRQNFEDIRRSLGDDAWDNIRTQLGEETSSEVSNMGTRQPSERGADNALDSGAHLDEDSNDIYFRSLDPESDEVVDNAEVGTRPLSDREKVAKLEAEPKVKVYRSMQLIDGKLYPPMSAKSEGQLREPSEIGVWEEADERPDLADDNGKFTLNKGNGKSLKAAYNPYIHTSRTMLNDQFSEAQSRPNLVVVEMEVPESELTSDYKAEKAKDSVGAKQWKAGVIQGQLSGTREVILSRWAKPVRIVPDSEVAANIAEQIGGQVAVMPSNVVTPSVRAELEKLGVQFVETDNTGKLVDGPNKGKTWASVYGKKANNAFMREGDNLPFINKTYEEGLAEARAAGYTKKQFDAMIERNERNARKRFADWAEKMHLTDKITFVDSVDELEGLTDKQREQRRDKKGWYNPRTDKIVIILDNHHSQDDVLQTILHEGVAHHGLRAMFGKAFDDFLDNVYAGAEYHIRQQIAKLAKNHGWNIHTATEEYLAGLAENTEFESLERSPFAEWWSKIKQFFLDMLHKLGIKGAFTEGDNIFSDNELRYILWRSYQNLVNPGRYRSFVDTANDVVMQDKLKVGDYAETSGEKGAWYAPAKAAEPTDNSKTLRDLKRENPDLLLLEDKGDHYEARGEDAKRMADILGVKPSSKGVVTISSDDIDNAMLRMIGGGLRVATYRNMKAAEDDVRFREGDGAMFREGDGAEDILNDRSIGLRERMTAAAARLAENNAGDVNAKNALYRAIGGNLADLRKAMGIQKEFDKSTVKRVADLAKILIRGGYLDNMSKNEVSRLLSAVNNATGKEEVNNEVKTIMDIMVNNQLKHSRERLSQLEKIRGSKVDSRGVVVQGVLDPAGQQYVRTFRDAKSMNEDALADMLAEQENKMTDPDNSVAEDAAWKASALRRALEYVQNIKAREDAIKQLRLQLREEESKVYDIDEVEIYDEEGNVILDENGEPETRKVKHVKQQFKPQKDENGMSIPVSEEKKQERKLVNETIAALEEAIQQNKIELIQAYAELSSRLSGSLKDSMDKARAFKDADVERVKAIQHNANSDMEGREMKGQRKDTDMDKLSNNVIARTALAPLVNFDQMLRLFGRKSPDGKGYLWERFMYGWQKAADGEVEWQERYMDKLNAKVKEIFGDNFKYRNLERYANSKEGMHAKYWDGAEMRDYNLPQSRMMYLYAVEKMPIGRATNRRMGLTDEDMEAIERNLDPKLKQFVDWVQEELLPELGAECNEVHKRMFGANMDAIENYFPFKRDKDALKKAVENGQQKQSDKITTKTGAIIKRTPSTAIWDMPNVNFMDVLTSHIQEMSHWANFAELNRDLGTLLSYNRFKQQVMGMNTIYGAGKKLWKNFEKVAAIATDAYEPKTSDYDKYVSQIAKGVTMGKVAARPFTAIKQLLSQPAFWGDADPIYMLEDLATLGLIPGFKRTDGGKGRENAVMWAWRNMPSFRKRIKSRTSGDYYLRDTEYDEETWISKIQDKTKWGMIPNIGVDAWTIALGSHAVYRTNKAKYLRWGMSEEEAEKRAIRDAELSFNKSQQSSEGAFIAPMQVDHTIAASTAMVFRNSSTSYTREYVASSRNLKRIISGEANVDDMAKQILRALGKEEWTDEEMENAKGLAKREIKTAVTRNMTNNIVYGWVLPWLWRLGGLLPLFLLSGDDDEKKKRFVEATKQSMFGPVEGVLYGDVLSDVLNKIVGNDDKEWKYIGRSNPIISDAQNIKDKIGYDPLGAITDASGILIGTVTGINPQTVVDWTSAIVDKCSGDRALSRECALLAARLLNCPPSQLKQIYFDELEMTGEEASHYTPEQLVERWAEYKVKNGHFMLTTPELVNKEKARTTKYVNERMGSTGDTKTEEEYSRYQEQYKEFDQQLKEYRGTSEYKNATPMEKAELLSDYRQDNAEGYAQYDLFKSMDATLTKWSKYYLTANTDKQAQVCKKAIEDYKKQMVAVMDATNDEQREAERKKLADIIEGFYEEYGNLMSTRTQEEKLEREMDRSLNKIDDAVDDANEVLNQ